MTCTVLRRQGLATDMVFTCDYPGCNASPTDAEIIAGGGMTQMGWTRRFNEVTRDQEHFCPTHSFKE